MNTLGFQVQRPRKMTGQAQSSLNWGVIVSPFLMIVPSLGQPAHAQCDKKLVDTHLMYVIMSPQKTDPLSVDYKLNTPYSATNGLLMRLKHLYEDLGENWDGYNGCPMEQAAYEHTQELIRLLPGAFAEKWNLFPCQNGTFLLSTKDYRAHISIGNTDFSYSGPQDDLYGIVPFTKDNVKKVIQLLEESFETCVS